MTVDIICPLYNAENYIENLHKSFEMQENVNINNILYNNKRKRWYNKKSEKSEL